MISKSPRCRPRTGCPRLSITVTSMFTTFTVIFSTNGGGAGTCALASNSAAITAIVRIIDHLIRSPYLTCPASDHRRVRRAVERLLELRQIRHDPVDAVFARRMRIRDRVCAQIFRPLVLARPLREPDEETLVGREAADRRRLIRIGRFPR